MIQARAFRTSKAFTIVEVLVVIVTLAILAAITIVAYDAVVSDADETTLKSDLKTAVDALELHKFESQDGKYPTDIADIDVHPTGDNIYNYSYNSYTDNYCLGITTPSLEGVEYFVSSKNQVPSKDPCADLGAKETSTACFAFNASTGTITSYYRNEDNNTANPACPNDVIIPREIGGVEVKILGGFSGKGIKSVVIPNTVTTINGGAFSQNAIESLTLPNSVKTVGLSAFFQNSLTNLRISPSVTSIGNYAFNSNFLPDDQAFIYHRNPDGSEDKTRIKGYGGGKKSGITLPSGVVSIEPYAFFYSNITSVTISSSVKTIGAYAFSINNLSSLTFESGITSLDIGENAFRESTNLPPVALPACTSYIASGTNSSFNPNVSVFVPPCVSR